MRLQRLRQKVGAAVLDWPRFEKSLRTGRTFLLDAAGSELFFDTRWWNQLPVSFGVRYSWLLDAGQLGISPNKWEIILPVNIFSR